MPKEKKDFISLLVESGLVNEKQIEGLFKLHAEQGGSLSELLITSGLVKEKDLMVFLSTYLSIPPIKLSQLKIDINIVNLIPKDFAEKYKVIAVGKIGNTLTVAVADPLNIVVLEDLEKHTGYQIHPVITLASELEGALKNYYKQVLTSEIEEIMKGFRPETLEIIKEEKEEINEGDLFISIEEAPIVKLTNYILNSAVELNASDILIEPLLGDSRVRFRVDGVLRLGPTFSRSMHACVISRIKVMANLNITEHRLPQDGRFRLKVQTKDIDFRVSLLPSILGEKITLRVLDKTVGLLSLNSLGFEPNICKQLQEDINSSYGMVLVCGPTGSGKTTTLYSLLKQISTPGKNIVTVEDPIEYQLKGINQVNVNYEVNLTFAGSLRSILRQDPDVIMIGEIRDFDTADIAIKSALTGHFVLSTLHTTTAVGSVTRLLNMGVESFLLSSTLIGVLAQRLIRQLCPKCKQADSLSEKLRVQYGIRKDAVIYKPQGCKHCEDQGYKGRVALGEYLHLDTQLRELVNESASQRQIKQLARKLGLRTLRENGIAKVEAGITSLEEILKVTSSDEEI